MSAHRERLLEALLQSATDYAIIALDLDGLVTFWNKGAERILGWNETEILGHPASVLFTLEDRRSGLPVGEMQAALREGRGNDERWHLKQDGSRFWASGEMMPLRDEAGVVQGFLKILRDRTGQRQAEEAQRADAEFLRSVLAASGDCIKVLDLDARLVFMTENGQRVMEVDDFEQIRGCPWPDFWQDEANLIARNAVAAARAGGIGHFQGAARTLAGTPRWWDVQITPIRGADGTPEKLLSVSRDITDSRRAAEDLRDAQGFNTSILNASRDCIVVLDLAGNTLFVSPGAIESMEISDADAVLGRSWLRVWQDADHQAASAAIAEACAGRTGRFQGFCPTHKGTPKWWDIAISPISGPDGAPRRLVSVGRDITETRQAEQRLRLLNESLEQRAQERTRALNMADARQRALFDTTRQLIGVLDLDGVIIDCNRAYLDAIGARLSDVVGQAFWDTPWFSGTPGMAPTIRDAVGAARSGRRVDMELPLLLPDGSLHVYDFAMRPVCDEAGRVVEIVPEATDITEQRRIEEQLRQSQKMEAVGQLTGGLAHDFNNLLTGITGSLELLQSRIAQNRLVGLDRYIDAALGACRRAASLTHRLLAFSRRQTLEPKPTDINRLVADMEELIRRTVGPQITVERLGTDDLWTAMVDPNQLENALLNLCINARDAMPDGGRLSLEAANSRFDEPAGRARDLAAGEYLSLRITDTGTGMTPGVIKRAVDPFFTTKPLGKGTGLGLSMVYGFARQSGGQLRIHSEIGTGTTMCLYLPRHRGPWPEREAAAVAASETSGADPGRPMTGVTVLVVDDEASVRMLVADVLQDLGYATIEAEDGAAALPLLQSGARIDLLVTDVGLPGGINGRQVADAGRACRPGLKVLFITGYANTALAGDGQLEPGMQLLTKPFALAALAARVTRLIAER